MIRRYGRVLAPVVAICLVLALASCAGKPQAPPQSAPAKPTQPAVPGSAQPPQAPGQAPTVATEVRVGAVYPLTGSAAAYGRDAKNGIELAVDIVNNAHPNVPHPLAKSAGLPNHGGAKVKVFWGDHEGSPEKALSETERLITQEKVHVVIGAMLSGPTATASQVAERYGIPFLSAGATSPSLSARGFKWFFNANTTDELFVRDAFQFLRDLNDKKSANIRTIGLIVEDTQYGQDYAATFRKWVKEFPEFRIVADLAYARGAPEMSAVIQRLKVAAPDAVMANTIGEDANTMLRDMRKLNLKTKAFIGRGGFVQKDVAQAQGKYLEYVFTPTLYAADLAAKKPIVKVLDEMFKARYNYPMADTVVRDMAGLLVLADALNRARDFSPEAIRAALQATSLDGNDLPISWTGVKFDARGQNQAGTTLMLQYIDKEWRTVWPFSLSSRELVYPFVDFDKR